MNKKIQIRECTTWKKPSEMLFSKTIINKGIGFTCPLEGSVCKFLIISDKTKLLGEESDQVKEIKIGEVDNYIGLILDNCLRTMKETEECFITFQYPESNAFSPNYDSENSKRIKVNVDVEVNSNLSIKNVVHNETSFAKVQFKLISFTPALEIFEMPPVEKWERANWHKERGSKLHAQGAYRYAFRRFSVSLKYLISVEFDDKIYHEDMDIKSLKLSCYLNMALCQLHYKHYEYVVDNASKALTLQPNNTKALYRRGVAYLNLQEYEKSEDDLKAAQNLDPENKVITKQLQILSSSVKKLNQYYANAMKKMFS